MPCGNIAKEKRKLIWDSSCMGRLLATVNPSLYLMCTRKFIDKHLASLYPPFDYCPNNGCDRRRKGLKLQKVDQTRAVLYTLDKGVCPAWIIRLQCEGKLGCLGWWDSDSSLKMALGCGTAYYHNYQVKNGLWHYYDGNIPAVVQVGEHQFVEHRVIKMWCTDTNISWCGYLFT